MAHKFRIVRLFDCQDMPRDVKSIFFCKSTCQDNGGYVNWFVYPKGKPLAQHQGHFIVHKYNVRPKGELPEYFIVEEGDNPVDDWLYKNGALIGEEVLIKHRW